MIGVDLNLDVFLYGQRSPANETEKPSHKFTVPDEFMYIDGSKFRDKLGDQSCYLPIFRNRDYANDTWIFGNIFMNQYYFTFDMTPLTEHN